LNQRILRIAALAAVAAAGLIAEDFSGVNGAPKWKVYDYNRSGQELRSRVPYSISSGGIEFPLLFTPDTALLVTSHPSYNGSLLGDLTGKTVFAEIAVNVTSGTQFTFYGTTACGTDTYVRFFFQTSGKFAETNYWWSNPVHVSFPDLVNLIHMTSGPVTFEGSQWTDYYGHRGNDPAYSGGFAAAVKDVQMIGLSFGGGCFFENGVGIVPGTGSGYFQLLRFSVQSSSH